MRRLSLDQLRTFAQVVELGTFSAAAERRNLTQPAVSLQVRQLEKALGVRLVERVGKRATPTAAGVRLLPHARRIEGDVAAALAEMADHANGAVGRVRLGTGATACIYILPPILRELRRRFPSLDILVSTGNTADILKAIEENELDIGLVTMPAPGRMFHVRPLIDDACVAIAPAGDDRLPATVTAATLARLPMVLYEPGGNTRRTIDAWFARAGISLKPIMELGSVEAIKELVGAGLGYSVLPRMALPQIGARDSITVRPLSPTLSRKLALVMRRDKSLTWSMREMIDALGALGARPPHAPKRPATSRPRSGGTPQAW